MHCQTQQSEAVKHSLGRLLLSHHPPEHIGRTLCIAWGQNHYRICARCTGMLLGIAVFCAAWGLDAAMQLPALALLPLSAGLVLPAVVDFNRQLAARRESTNRRRLITGAMFGFALAWSLRRCAEGQWWPLMLVVSIVGGGFVWLVLSPRRLVRLLQHLQLYGEYYRRCRTEDVRRAARKRVVKV